MRRLIVLFCVTVYAGCSSAHESLDGGREEEGAGLVLSNRTNDPVFVPTSGPLFDQRLVSVGEDVLEADVAISELTTSQDEVEREVAAIAEELRDDAVNEVDLVLRIARRTSGGLDTNILERASHWIQEAKLVLKAAPPPSLRVNTTISAALPGRMLHFMSAGDYREKRGFWESYTSGSRMHIGIYVFRILPCGEFSEGYIERVVILEEPTQKTIHPTC